MSSRVRRFQEEWGAEVASETVMEKLADLERRLDLHPMQSKRYRALMAFLLEEKNKGDREKGPLERMEELEDEVKELKEELANLKRQEAASAPRRLAADVKEIKEELAKLKREREEEKS